MTRRTGPDARHPRRRLTPAHRSPSAPGEALVETARRELAEETGILLDHIGPHLRDRETRFRYRGREHHRRESVYLARITHTAPTLRPKHTPNEKAEGLWIFRIVNPLGLRIRKRGTNVEESPVIHAGIQG
ncbi:MAG: NUDIX domain-containing protein [Pseudonocardiaceae bacterium]